MKIGILTFQGFNEIDSFIALHILCRVNRPDWEVYIVSPTQKVVSMNGVAIESHKSLDFLNKADAVLIGSSKYMKNIINNQQIISLINIDPQHQLIGSQCSGALVMAKLGLLKHIPACTNVRTRPYLEQHSIEVLEMPFYCKGNLATAGGCLSAQYLAAWVIYKTLGQEKTVEALNYVLPIGENGEYISRILSLLKKEN